MTVCGITFRFPGLLCTSDPKAQTRIICSQHNLPFYMYF